MLRPLVLDLIERCEGGDGAMIARFVDAMPDINAACDIVIEAREAVAAGEDRNRAVAAALGAFDAQVVATARDQASAWFLQCAFLRDVLPLLESESCQ